MKRLVLAVACAKYRSAAAWAPAEFQNEVIPPLGKLNPQLQGNPSAVASSLAPIRTASGRYGTAGHAPSIPSERESSAAQPPTASSRRRPPGSPSFREHIRDGELIAVVGPLADRTLARHPVNRCMRRMVTDITLGNDHKRMLDVTAPVWEARLSAGSKYPLSFNRLTLLPPAQNIRYRHRTVFLHGTPHGFPAATE